MSSNRGNSPVNWEVTRHLLFGSFALIAGCTANVIPGEGAQVEVFIWDQSIQCRFGSGVKSERYEEMLVEVGVKVFAYRHDYDRKMYPAVCGAPTGGIHVFQIDAAGVRAAESIGFTKLPESW